MENIDEQYIPLITQNGKFANTTSSEFDMSYNARLGNNLMNPTDSKVDYDTGVDNVAVRRLSGTVNDSSESIFANNGDGATEERTETLKESAAYVKDRFYSAQPSSQRQRNINEYTSESGLSTEFSTDIQKEQGPQQSGDGVDGMRRDNLTVQLQQNDLKLPPKGSEAVGDLLNRLEDRKFRRQFDPFNMGVKALFDVAKREKELFDLEQKRNLAFVERYKPVGPDTLNQEFIKFAKGFY